MFNNYYKKVNRFCEMPSLELKDLLSTLRTGDVILTRFDHLSDLGLVKHVIGNILYTLVSSIYTHTCVVVRVPSRNNSAQRPDKLYAYTAINSPYYDYVSKTYKEGSMLIDLSTYLMTYPGNIVVYRLLPAVLTDTEKLYTFIANNGHRIFETNVLKLLNTELDIVNNKEDLNKTICSQTVGDALIALGIMPPVHTPNLGVHDICKFIQRSNKYQPPIMLMNVYSTHQCKT